VEISPSDVLIFDDHLPPPLKSKCHNEKWLRSIYYGILDVMIVKPMIPKPMIPKTIFKCVVEHVEFHEIDSSRRAFRLAGRYAAEAYLAHEKYAPI
jgi:hypothetical protein